MQQYKGNKQPARFSEPYKLLPIAYVFLTITCIYYIYVVYHCEPMLQSGTPATHVDAATKQRAMTQLIIFHFLTGMLLICYLRCILVHPGTIPDNDPQWDYRLAQQTSNAFGMIEKKQTGERRHCKWCMKYKPDRCHHCRVCRTCILKMDHHCPWIYNCVGFYNYKYFLLFVFYSALTLHFVFWTMMESFAAAVNANSPFGHMFVLLFGQTIAFFIGSLVTMFFIFHMWLVQNGLTTIEFCEKRQPVKDEESGETAKGGLFGGKRYEPSVYDIDFWANLRIVLGEYMIFWLLPCVQPDGDGLFFDRRRPEGSRPESSLDETTVIPTGKGKKPRLKSGSPATSQTKFKPMNSGYGTYGMAGDGPFAVQGSEYYR